VKANAVPYSNNVIDNTVFYAVKVIVMHVSYVMLIHITYAHHTCSGHILTCYIQQALTTHDALDKRASLLTH